MLNKTDITLGIGLIVGGAILQTVIYGMAVMYSQNTLDMRIIRELKLEMIDAQDWRSVKTFEGIETNSTQKARQILSDFVGILALNVTLEYTRQAERFRGTFFAENNIFMVGIDAQNNRQLLTSLLKIYITEQKIAGRIYHAYELTDALLVAWGRDVFIHTYIEDLIKEKRPSADILFQNLLANTDYTTIESNVKCEGGLYRVQTEVIDPTKYGIDCRKVEATALDLEREFILKTYSVVLNAQKDGDELSSAMVKYLNLGQNTDPQLENIAKLFAIVLLEDGYSLDFGGMV